MKKILLILFISAASNVSIAQWLPVVRHTNLPVFFTYEPVCDSNRRQVRVRLIDSTQFNTFLKPTNDISKGAVLYVVKFISSGHGLNVTGKAYCEPHRYKNSSELTGFREKNLYESSAASGFSQCLFDYNEDGFFDGGATGFAWYFPNTVKITKDHQYKYEIIESNEPPEIGCPRGKKSLNVLSVSEPIWLSLSQNERDVLKQQGEIELFNPKEVGAVLQSEKLNQSTPGNNAGAVLGERIGAASYIDNSFNNGNYSARGQLGAQVLGAVIGSTFNTAPKIEFITRYSIKTVSGELFTVDKTTYRNDFSIANGTCVSYPNLEQVDQSVCESTISSFRNKHLSTMPQSEIDKKSKETRLRELKDLFDKGLVTERIFLEQQKVILDN